MRDDQTLFGKAEAATAESTRESAKESAAAEAEREEALSRAAREAVRQPADPRLEKSFAHLGLAADEAPAAPARAARAAAGHQPPGTPLPIDLEPIREELARWKASAIDLSRRLEVVTWILFALTLIIGLLAIVLIVRG